MIRKGWLLLFLSFQLMGFSGNLSFDFFSKEDIASIQRAAKTEWGKPVIDKLKEIVNERRKHALNVPLLEGGHLHDYFCPVHNQMFVFDWESPNAHYCKSCNKKWEANKRYDWAWINRLHEENLRYLEACMFLYLATDETVYAKYITSMMLDYAYKYPTYFEHNTNRLPTSLNSGRLFGQSLDESVWASTAARAVDVVRAVMSEDDFNKIKTGYLTPCAQMLLKRRGGGNWQVWHNSGLIALGVALEDDSIINVALNDPQCGYHHLMKVHVYDDGWWNEGSPIYHYYPLRAMLLSADALRCRGINLYDAKLEKMLTAPALGVYADLTFPAHNDGWYGESLSAQVKLYEIADARYKNPFFGQILENCYVKTDRLDTEALLNFKKIEPKENFWGNKGYNFEQLGVGVLRSKSTTLVLKYGPYGGGHGHPDKLSISLHNGKEEVLSDLGTSAYGVPDFTRWYRKTLSHSTVAIDAKDQLPVTGNLIAFQTNKSGGTVEALVNDAAKGVSMKRKLTLRGKVITDVFTCNSDEKHQYDYVLIFTNRPVVQGTKEIDTRLTDAPQYELITGVKKQLTDNVFTCETKGAEVKFTLPDKADFEVFVGEATGIPPSNPSVKTNDDAGSRPVQSCYPLIIRIKEKNALVRADWKLK